MRPTRKLRPNVEQALRELQENPETQPIRDPPFRKVKSIQFGILSPEEIKSMSVCEVTGADSNTVYDMRMGPAVDKEICATCNEDNRVCPGHFGHITLNKPIIHPMFSKFIVTIANCICLNCSKLKMTREEIDLEINVLECSRYIRYIDRLNIIVKKCENIAYCSSCSYAYPKVKMISKKDKTDTNIYKVYEGVGGGEATKSRLEISELRTILSKITDDDLEIMGFQPQTRNIVQYGKISEKFMTFRPEWLIITHLPVLPPMSRPPDTASGDRNDDDLTTSYTDIIKYNGKVRESSTNEVELASNIAFVQKHIGGLFDNSKGIVIRSSGKVAKGISERIKGKEGQIRNKMLGKRIDFTARTVITADTKLNINEVGIPEVIAKTLSFPEKVTPRNISKLKLLLSQNKINMIIRDGSKIKHLNAIKDDANRSKIKLCYGDVVYRQLQNGDTVVVNRQPTLHRGGMMEHKTVVLPGKTIRLNLVVTGPYNADFDGRLESLIAFSLPSTGELKRLLSPSCQ